MARECFELINIEESISYSLEFIHNFHTALLLALLDKNLLTRRQFEACEEEIQKRKRNDVLKKGGIR